MKPVKKPITIDGQEWEYENYWSRHYRVWLTDFYQGTETRKKFYFFGKEISVPRLIFRLHFNIENPNYSKDYIKKKIDEQLKFINRKKEIEKGEII